jgi:hypothetical protein
MKAGYLSTDRTNKKRNSSDYQSAAQGSRTRLSIRSSSRTAESKNHQWTPSDVQTSTPPCCCSSVKAIIQEFFSFLRYSIRCQLQHRFTFGSARKYKSYRGRFLKLQLTTGILQLRHTHLQTENPFYLKTLTGLIGHQSSSTRIPPKHCLPSSPL